MPNPLRIFTKTFDPDDMQHLTTLPLVDQYFGSEHPQDPHRRWEYGLALEAILAWEHDPGTQIRRILDVGGAGSPLIHMLQAKFPRVEAEVVDGLCGMPLDAWIAAHPEEQADIVTCISVIEHVENLEQFAYDLARVTAPGGLLFVTADYWEAPSTRKDTAHFHWMRERIFCPETWKALQVRLGEYGLVPYGETDWSFHGHHLFGSYTFVSLCMRRG